MGVKDNSFGSEFYARFKVFHELMKIKIKDILLVSSPYDAFLMEEDGSLSSKIINEYRGLNLSLPPRITRTSSAYDALSYLKKKKFDMVITMPHLEEMDAFSLGIEIKKIEPGLPVILLAQSPKNIYPLPEDKNCLGIDKIFIWTGNSDLLLAVVKNAEDRLNVDHDTQKAMVRVLILVENSPVFYSTFLPLIYKEIVKQTQVILEAGLNEEHKLLTMRTRPKILLAENFEEALELTQKFRTNLFGVIAGNLLLKNSEMVADAGFQLLSKIRDEFPDLPLLLIDNDPKNREKANEIPAVFLDKNSPRLLAELHSFFMTNLRFGDFIFRMPNGKEICRASGLRQLQEKISQIPDESLWHHARRNHFSNWIMARSEITLALALRKAKADEFSNAEELRQYIITSIHQLRRWRQQGVVVQFNPDNFDPHIKDFVKIGEGSLGGKGRSLAFMSAILQEHQKLNEKHSNVNIIIPRTMVISTDGFESFVKQNDLSRFSGENVTDQSVTENFLKADLPDYLNRQLEAFLKQVEYPLSIRSSSLMEDAQFQPYAGLYETYMIPNNHTDFPTRLRHLITAVKLVYASTYYEGPKAFARNTSNNPRDEKMAVIIQQIAGAKHGDYFYPTISGVAQSHNFYPVSHMKSEEGIAHIALGFGKTVVEGEKTLRFSPKYPSIMPQFSSVDDILANAQRHFYALKMRNYSENLNFDKNSNLEKREVDDANTEFPLKTLAGTYITEEHRIRDTAFIPGPKVLTFAQVLKYNIFPLPQLLCDFLELGRKSMGCPVEIEFVVNLNPDKERKSDFFFLQMRPMVADEKRFDIPITEQEFEKAVCRSYQALGNGKNDKIADIVYVKPDDFKLEALEQMVKEINLINANLLKEKRPYLLIGPGRWGSADRWLGIPVQWHNISGVSAIIELRNDKLKADPSQGYHFFQNITSLGIHYITVNEGSADYLDWKWLYSLPVMQETDFLRHVKLEKPMMLKIDGRKSQCVVTAAG
ncbi:MAG: phosphoenolpyruvate synthase/pyruvate phosphate dikinase [Desulfobacterales bacterium]|nr:phosphoenolpyruvate synthase/pyruvate phosphate dikinase [Desulfobacterales bacterium]